MSILATSLCLHTPLEKANIDEACMAKVKMDIIFSPGGISITFNTSIS